jgi:AsmA protein
LESGNEKLRLHPITAEFFEGSYDGDVRIDVSGATPTLSVNERISNVNVQVLARTVFEAEDISGMIDGNFTLNGSGATMSEIQSGLNGTMSFSLADGTLEGIDVWHQLRSARALYKREEAPQPVLPARTKFTAIEATGTVLQGVFSNDDLLVELPFMRIMGNGTIDLNSSVIDYSVQARVLDNPEFMNDVSAEELADFTEVLIPIKIRGTLDAPSFRPDIEAMFKREVEKAIQEKTEELKQNLLDKLLQGQQRSRDSEQESGDAADEEQKEEEKLEDQLKDKLKDIFKF